MKVKSSQLVAAAAVLSMADALKSSVRGGANSDTVDKFATGSSLPKRRFLHHDNGQQAQQHERRAQDQSSYWWLSKTSSEKDVVYKPAEEAGEGDSASNGKDSFAVFTIDIDNNPDTSDLPYRAPSREPTPHPTPVPTETITTISTTESTVQLAPPVDAVEVQLAPPQNSDGSIAPQDIVNYNPPQDIIDIVGYAEKLDGTAYHFPIWSDTFKGCTSSATVPGAYISFADEYIFSSNDACCKEWFDSEDCSGDGMIIMSSSEENLDQYMFRMNGPEAYSGGGDSSEDYSSNDNRPAPTPSDTEEFVTGPPISTTVTLPPIGSGTPTYHPTSGTSFPDITVTGNETEVLPITYPPISSGSTDPPVGGSTVPPVGGSTAPPIGVGSPAPTPGAVVNYTPYPTFSALVDQPTPPPIFEVSVSTPAPSAAGSGGGGGSILPTLAVSIVSGTAPPVAQGTNPPVSMASSFPTAVGSGNGVVEGASPAPAGGTQWPTFSDGTPQPSSGGTEAGSSSSTITSTLAATSNSTAAGSGSSTTTSTLEGTSTTTAAGSGSSTTTSTLEGTSTTTLEGTDGQNATLRTAEIEDVVSKGTRLFMSHAKRHSDD